MTTPSAAGAVDQFPHDCTPTVSRLCDGSGGAILDLSKCLNALLNRVRWKQVKCMGQLVCMGQMYGPTRKGLGIVHVMESVGFPSADKTEVCVGVAVMKL